MQKLQAYASYFGNEFNGLSGSVWRAYTVTWVPTSTTRPVGIWKKSVASLAERASAMNR
jgi:hypothetical protein